MLETDVISEELLLSDDWYDYLPKWIMLENDLGYLKLKSHPIVPRIHVSTKKEGYESYYSEMMLHTSWRDEEKELHPKNPTKCMEEYKKRSVKISDMKEKMFPGEVFNESACDHLQQKLQFK